MTHEERIEAKIDRLGDTAATTSQSVATLNAKFDMVNTTLGKVTGEIDQIREGNAARGKRIGKLEQDMAVANVKALSDHAALKEHFSQELRAMRRDMDDKIKTVQRAVFRGGGAIILAVAIAVLMRVLGIK